MSCLFFPNTMALWSLYISYLLLSCLFISITPTHAEESTYGISGNPGAVNILTGTGELGKFLHIPKRAGVRLGGLWMGDYNALLNRGQRKAVDRQQPVDTRSIDRF